MSPAYRRSGFFNTPQESLLTLRLIQLSQNEQYRGHHRLLQLFAYGTFEDYLSALNILTTAAASKARI
jgi:hypothetical protein